MQFVVKLGGRGRWYFNGTEHGYVPVTVDPTVSQIGILSCFQLGHRFKIKVNVKESCLSSLKIEVLSLNMSICKQREQLERQLNCLGIGSRKARQTQFLTV